MAMEHEEFSRGVMNELHAIRALLVKLTNQDYCNRALLMALVEQPGLNPAQLAEDYEDNLQRILEQVPPALQRRETYETSLAEIRDRLQRSRGKPYAG